MTDGTTITVYSRPNCQMCMATKRSLTKKNIPFVDAQVDHAPDEVIDHIHRQNYTTAPVVIVTDAAGQIVDSCDVMISDNYRRLLD